MDRNCCLIVFFLYTQKVAKCCVHEKKMMLKKKEGWAIRGTIGSCPQVPVILKSVSLSDPMLCATFTYAIMSTAVLVVTSKPNFYFQAKLVNNYMYISIKFCICLLIQDQEYLISDQLRELSRQCLFHITFNMAFNFQYESNLTYKPINEIHIAAKMNLNVITSVMSNVWYRK